MTGSNRARPPMSYGALPRLRPRRRNNAWNRAYGFPAVISRWRHPLNKIRLTEGTIEWQVKKLIPLTGVGLVWGPSQTYKSFWLFDLVMHIALGWSYQGKADASGRRRLLRVRGRSRPDKARRGFPQTSQA